MTTDPTPEPTAVPDDENPVTGESKTASNREAKYRRQLRETEAARDALAARLETMQRAEVERIAAAKLKVPGTLWQLGTTLADMLDEEGNVDPDKVTTAAKVAVSEAGLAPKRSGAYSPNEGRTPEPPGMGSFESAFQPY